MVPIYSFRRKEVKLLLNLKLGETGTCPYHPDLLKTDTLLRDSYTDPIAHFKEIANPFPFSSRGLERYDPYTRKYTKWHNPNDFYGHGVDGYGLGSYPHFTADEWQKMARRLAQGKRIKPGSMGSEWHHDGPKVCDILPPSIAVLIPWQRFRQEHDWFWQESHRIAENLRQRLPPYSGINQNFLMHQRRPEDLNDWVVEAF